MMNKSGPLKLLLGFYQVKFGPQPVSYSIVQLESNIFSLVKFEIELCWVFNQNCFLGEIDGNPESNLLKLDHRSFEGSSRHPSSVVNLC